MGSKSNSKRGLNQSPYFKYRALGLKKCSNRGLNLTKNVKQDRAPSPPVPNIGPEESGPIHVPTFFPTSGPFFFSHAAAVSCVSSLGRSHLLSIVLILAVMDGRPRSLPHSRPTSKARRTSMETALDAIGRSPPASRPDPRRSAMLPGAAAPQSIQAQALRHRTMATNVNLHSSSRAPAIYQQDPLGTADDYR